MTETFICVNCGKVCIPKKNNWRKLYCSKKCNDLHYVKTHPQIRRKAWRKYVDTHREEQKVRSKTYYKENKEKVLLYNKQFRLENNARTRAKNVAKKFMDKICKECGSIINIHLHHKDYNVFNNNIDNLVYLCSICHGEKHQIPKYKGDNILKK